MKQIISLYSGADGLGFGAKLASFPPTIAIDIDSDCCKTVKLNNPECEVLNERVQDIADSLPNKPHVIIGGPPCQDFSNANTKRQFDLTLVNEFWNIVEKLKPKYYLMENVPGLFLKFKKGSSKFLNCANYGVPQTRRRRFWTNISIPKATYAKKSQNDLFGGKLKKWVSVREALNLSKDWFISPTGFADKNKKEITRRINEPAQTIVCGNEYQLTNYKIFSTKYLKYKNPIMFKKHPPISLDKPASTIKARDRASPDDYISDQTYARKLTNLELAILQGFPKEFKFYGSKTSVRKQIGNAVPPPIGKAFFENTF